LVPPGESRQKEVRCLDLHEDDQLDEAQFADWVKRARQLPGERMCKLPEAVSTRFMLY
jgi:hypothetical protein